MRILILENSRRRIRKFKENLVEHDVTFCTNALQGLETLRTRDFDVLMLDHDLAGAIFHSKTRYYSGGYFVKEALQVIRNSDTIKVIFLHSWNWFGARRMEKMLEVTGKLVVRRRCKWML